tara:strand:- start:271 stop:516 length:246 start_codon:yes stop_codon:yes gene_type:complete
MSRGLTQEQKNYLDEVMKEFRQRTGIAMGSVRRMSNQDYEHVLEMNDFESIYQEVNMYLFDNRDRRYDLHKKYIPLKDRVI